MSFWKRLKKKSLASKTKNAENIFPAGASLPDKDTISVIRDLSQVLMHDPDALELYLALGNLYRSKGDLEKAVQIRESLLVRPDSGNKFKGRTYFELGQDYRRAGLLDRALSAYSSAIRHGIPEAEINTELAALYASAGDLEKACYYYSSVGNRIAEAHYLTKLSFQIFQQDNKDNRAQRGAERAIKIYPGSPEAWSLLIAIQARQGKWNSVAKNLAKSLDNIAKDRQFMLFEELLELKPHIPEAIEEFYRQMAEIFIPVLEKRPPEFVSAYYGAVMLERCGRKDEADQWYSKALVVQPEFWPARLAQVDIARANTSLPPVIDSNLDFFINRSKSFKKFVCTTCGLKRQQLFYCCQRCYSWHSATYNMSISD